MSAVVVVVCRAVDNSVCRHQPENCISNWVKFKVDDGTHTLVYMRGFNEKPVRCAALLNIVVIMFHVRHNFVCVRVMFNPIGRVLESIRVCHGV